MMAAYRSLLTLVIAMTLAFGQACGGEPPTTSGSPRVGNTPTATPGSAAVQTEKAVAAATGQAPAAAAAGRAPAAGSASREQGMRRVEITQDLFIPSDDNRDPFEAFQFEAAAPEPTAPGPTEGPGTTGVGIAENILFPDRELKDLRCRMILAMAGEKPRAYLLGPDGRAGYVTQGEYVGRPFFQGGAGVRTEVYWRVYEVMEGGVSFEASVTAAEIEDTGPREAMRLYTDEEMQKFTDLFLLR